MTKYRKNVKRKIYNLTQQLINRNTEEFRVLITDTKIKYIHCTSIWKSKSRCDDHIYLTYIHSTTVELNVSYCSHLRRANTKNMSVI